MWVRRRYLAVLFDLYAEWHRHLTQRERETGEPFDLMLWLFHPRFHQTQLVAAVGDRVAYYHGLFPESEGEPGPPPTQYASGDYDLESLAWAKHPDREWVETWELDAWPDWGAWFERSIRDRVIERTDDLIVCRYGDVWVGR